MTREDLAGKPREELVEIAKRLKIKVHPKSKDETIIYKILQQPQAYQNAAVEPDAKPEVKAFSNTKEEILEAIAPQLAKEGFKADFPGDGTVIFTYRGLSESVNMSIPLHVIKRQAQMAAKVKFAPSMVNDGQGGKIMMM